MKDFNIHLNGPTKDFDIQIDNQTQEFDIYLSKRLTECDILVYSMPFPEGMCVVNRLILDSCMNSYSLKKMAAMEAGSAVSSASVKETAVKQPGRMAGGVSFAASVDVVVGRFRILSEVDERTLADIDVKSLDDLDFITA